MNLESVSPNRSPETSPDGWIRDNKTDISFGRATARATERAEVRASES